MNLNFHCNRRTYLSDILVSPGACNIPILDGQTLKRERFIREFAYNIPIVVRDATDNSIFRAFCQVSKCQVIFCLLIEVTLQKQLNTFNVCFSFFPKSYLVSTLEGSASERLGMDNSKT